MKATLLLVALWLGCTGCSGDPAAPAADGSAGAAADDERSGFVVVNCDDVTVTAVGDVVVGGDGRFEVVMVEVDPLPAERDTSWTLEVHDTSGRPIEDAVIEVDTIPVSVGNAVTIGEPMAVPLDKPGRYRAEDVHFLWTGPWEVRFIVEAQDHRDAASFFVCVE